MLFPVRCFTCNKVIGNKWETYKYHLSQNVEIDEVFNLIKIKRYCCKRHFTTHVDLFEEFANAAEVSVPNVQLNQVTDKPRVYQAI